MSDHHRHDDESGLFWCLLLLMLLLLILFANRPDRASLDPVAPAPESER